MDWGSDEDEYFSGHDNSYDSDIIDSDIEADLYSIIHHQEETCLINDKEDSIQEKNKVDKNSCSKQQKTSVNENDVSGEIYSVRVSQNSQNFADIQTIKYQNELNNGNLTKRKSSVVSDLLNDFQLSTKKFKTITESNKNLHKDTSDDDSDIICLGSQETENQLQTNLSHTSISLDCSSGSNDSWYGRLSNNSSTLSNRNFKDIWHINEEDLYRYKRRSRRYHVDELINCSNCNEKGHIARNCSINPVMKCYFCGRRHNPANCKKRTCAKCFVMGHDSRFCKSKIFTCMLCNMMGHPEHECPDLWRRYHLTTSHGIIRNSRLFQDLSIFCYNCGDLGHFGGLCKESKMNVMTSFQTWPLVINYAQPNIAYSSRSRFDKPLDIEEKLKRQRTEKSERRKLKRRLKNAKIRAQQNDFSRTPKSERVNESILNVPTDIELQVQKIESETKKAKKLKLRLQKLEALRQKILSRPVDISFPLLDFLGQSNLPSSYKTVTNRAKKERKMLRKLMMETYGSNNTSVSPVNKN